MTKPKDIDWQSVELQYRAGIKTLAAIGSEFGISDAGIIKRAKRDGWTRDLKVRIKAATEAKLAELASPERLASEELVVSANANLQVETVKRQRASIDKLSGLSEKLTDELIHETVNLELYEKLGELMYAPDEKGKDKLNEIYKKVISSGSRIGSFRSLIESQKTLIGLQRQNVGLADNANGEADKPEQQTEISDTEAARRVAFMFAKAMRNQETTQ